MPAYFFMLSLLTAAGEPSLDISFFGSPLFMPVVLFMEPLLVVPLFIEPLSIVLPLVVPGLFILSPCAAGPVLV